MLTIETMETDLNALVGRNLRRLRERRGLSQKALAHMIDIDPPRVSEWEGGRRGIGKENLARLCMALGAEPYEFYIKEEQLGLFPRDEFEREFFGSMRKAQSAGVAEEGKRFMDFLVNESAKGLRPRAIDGKAGLETVGNRITYFRTMLLNKSLEEFSDEIHITRRQLIEIEGGREEVPASMLTSLIEIYSKRFDHSRLLNWILTGRGEIPKEDGELHGGENRA